MLVSRGIEEQRGRRVHEANGYSMASHVSGESWFRPGIMSTVPTPWVLGTRSRLYTAMTGDPTAHIAATHDVGNPHKGLVSYGRRRSWWSGYYASIFGDTFSLMCPKLLPAEILRVENTDPSVYRARRDDGGTAAHITAA